MFSELLTEKNKELYFTHFRIEPKQFTKRRIIYALILMLLALAMAIIVNEPLFYLVVVVMAFFGYKMPYFLLLSRKSKEDLMNQYEFPEFLLYFKNLISIQGNVYQTLKATIPNVRDPIKTYLIELVDELETNPVNNREAFLSFAEKIGNDDASLVMEMINELNEQGINKDYIKELETTIKRIQTNRAEEIIQKKVRSMENFGYMVLIYTTIFIFLFAGLTIWGYLPNLQFNING